MERVTIELSSERARRVRWHAQLLGGSDLTPTEVVERAVALQGQDLPAVLRAIAIRSAPGTTVADVTAAFDRGELVRSWPMRGTLFATTPTLLAAILAHSAERTHRSTATRRAALHIDDAVLDRARGVLNEALSERMLTRTDALAALEAAGVATGAGRGYHLLMHFAVDGLHHWGPFDESGTEQLLVRTPQRSDSDDLPELSDLLSGVILARGPITEDDLAWWTKLPKGAIRPALPAIPELVAVTVEGRPALTIGEPPLALPPTGVTLVPGFDEWILGYADRTLVATPAAFDALVPGGNGVFRPAVLVDGRVVGSWRVPIRAGRPLDPVVDIVERVSAADRRRIDAALAAWPHARPAAPVALARVGS